MRYSQKNCFPIKAQIRSVSAEQRFANRNGLQHVSGSTLRLYVTFQETLGTSYERSDDPQDSSRSEIASCSLSSVSVHDYGSEDGSGGDYEDGRVCYTQVIKRARWSEE
jgi:hypothetical protein